MYRLIFWYPSGFDVFLFNVAVMTVEEDGKDNGNKEAENVTSKSNADIVSQALQGRGVLSLQNLGTELEKQLKLPPKHVVKGRPKGKKKVQDIRKKGRNDANNDEDEVEDVDGDLTVKQCDVCKGPVTCRTSFSKKNYGRTIITCSTRKTDDCRAFYKWDMPVDIPPPSSGRVQSEQQDTAAGNPLINPEEQAENNPCFICKTQGPPTGAHQCDMCSKAIHILDGSCSVATSIVVEGFGKTGRICLKCAKDLTPDDGEAFDEPGSTHSAHISPTSSPERSKSHSQIISQVSTPVKTAQVSDNFPPVTKTPTTDKICFGCGQKAVLRTSTKGRSMGQKFYTCSNPVSERCRKFINWTKWVPTGSPTLANKTIPEFFPQVDRAKESATRSSYHELLDDNEGDNILSNVLDLPSTLQLPEVNNTDVMGMETGKILQFLVLFLLS
ncbi:uncharacterized protein LOC127750831 [Frankliniella occidentalis]|uniref:Uncharacterized protein LOC127750831 n=1 Tax=Frankliniella occidentalis TaxID=133901 RepID=A0A9C6X599_FRAOC|nr:uncharacterized protein LOC127750831 [Frankliniella occidentalis]